MHEIQTLIQGQEGSHKRPHIIPSLLYETPRIGLGGHLGLQVKQNGRRVKKLLIKMGIIGVGVYLWGDENVLRFIVMFDQL